MFVPFVLLGGWFSFGAPVEISGFSHFFGFGGQDRPTRSPVNSPNI